MDVMQLALIIVTLLVVFPVENNVEIVAKILAEPAVEQVVVHHVKVDVILLVLGVAKVDAMDVIVDAMVDAIQDVGLLVQQIAEKGVVVNVLVAVVAPVHPVSKM